MAEKDRTTALPADQFERLTRAVETIAGRASITTTVEPRPLDGDAKKAAEDYGLIARSLRTIFEPVATPVPTTNPTAA
jgi:hypothetical protein